MGPTATCIFFFRAKFPGFQTDKSWLVNWSCPHREPEIMPVEGSNRIFREDVSVWEKPLFRLDLRRAMCRVSLGSQQEVRRGGGDDRPGTELPHKQEVLV